MFTVITGLLALSALGVAQGPPLTSPQIQSLPGHRCGNQDGSYCYKDNLQSPYIVHCINGKSSVENCNDRFGAEGSTRNINPCYQPNPRRHDAACSTSRGMVYPENGRRPFLRPDYRPYRPPGLDGSVENLPAGDTLSRDAPSEKQFGRPGPGQGGYPSQGGYGGRPGGYGGQGGYGGGSGQGQPPFGNGNNNNQNNRNNNQNNNQNQNQNNNANNNINNNVNNNQNQNTNANQNANGNRVGRPPTQDTVKEEVRKRQEDNPTDDCEDDGDDGDDDLKVSEEEYLIPPSDDGDDSPGKRSVVNTAKKSSSARVEIKTCGIVIAMAVVVALV